ncbi:MAG TPA: hypothetical protein VIX19_03095 [Terriglobales bacterium]
MGGASLPKEINVREVTYAAIEAAKRHGDKRKAELIADDILLCNLPTEADPGA